MIGFSDLRSISITPQLFEESHSRLKAISAAGVESLVLWAGRRSGHDFEITDVLAPEQHGVVSAAGMYVIVGGTELHRINVWLYEHRLQLIAQVHTHPGNAYHSDTDDAIPIVTTEGGLSLVVPDFACGPASLDTYSTYRLSTSGHWLALSAGEKRSLLQIRGL